MRTSILPPALVQAAPARDSIAIAADVASIVIAVAIVVLAALASLLFLRINRIVGEVSGGARRSLGPASEKLRAISDNVEFVTQVVRSDVERLNESVRALADRLTHASERMEERIEEFNALMEVVQDEAEEMFIDTASTVRGVRAGARNITSGRRQGPDEPTERGPQPRAPREGPGTRGGRANDQRAGKPSAEAGEPVDGGDGGEASTH